MDRSDIRSVPPLIEICVNESLFGLKKKGLLQFMFHNNFNLHNLARSFIKIHKQSLKGVYCKLLESYQRYYNTRGVVILALTMSCEFIQPWWECNLKTSCGSSGLSPFMCNECHRNKTIMAAPK
jgi:hypothetical protein